MAKAPDAQVSLTMPVRLESWVSRDLHPVFQMNLPEGALLETIRRSLANGYPGVVFGWRQKMVATEHAGKVRGGSSRLLISDNLQL